MKLLQAQHVSPDSGRVRANSDNTRVKPVAAVEPVERARVSLTQGKGSYATEASYLPGQYVEHHHAAVNAYRSNAAIDPDAGELIGIDTYA